MAINRRIPQYETSADASGGAAAVCIPQPSRTLAGSGWINAGHRLISRLPPQEWRRRAIHMSPGLLPAALLAIPHPDPLAWYSQVIIAAVISGMTVFALRKADWFARHDETGWN